MTDHRPWTRAAADRRPRPTTALGWGLWTYALVFAIIGFLAIRPGGPTDIVGVTQSAVAALTYASVGATLVTRLPRHPIGWLLLAAGVLIATGAGSTALADHGLNANPGSVPGAVWFAWLSTLTNLPVFGVLGLYLPIVYPSGRLPSQRWRPFLLVATAALAIGELQRAVWPFTVGSYPAGVENPFVLGGAAGDAFSAIGVVGVAIGLLSFLPAMGSLLIRYRRATGVERQQFKWFALVAAVMVPALVLAVLTGSEISGPVAVISNGAWEVAVGGAVLLPVALGFAVLRYRLFEIDTIINRAIVYTLLTAILAGATTTIVGLAEKGLAGVVGPGSDTSIVLSTLVVVSAFEPVKRRVQGLVDRRFKEVADPAIVLAGFVESLREFPGVLSADRTWALFLQVAARAYRAEGGEITRAPPAVGDPSATGNDVASLNTPAPPPSMATEAITHSVGHLGGAIALEASATSAVDGAALMVRLFGQVPQRGASALEPTLVTLLEEVDRDARS